MRVALSNCTQELLCFKYTALNPHMSTCACISMGADVLCVQTNISQGDFLFLLQLKLLLPRPLKPLREGGVAESISSVLPICSFSQHLKSPRSAAISSNLSQGYCGGTGGGKSQRLTVAICTRTQEGQLHTLLLPINRPISDPHSEATGHVRINIFPRQTALFKAVTKKEIILLLFFFLKNPKIIIMKPNKSTSKLPPLLQQANAVRDFGTFSSCKWKSLPAR